MVFDMERRLREIGGSYVITIPKQVCDLYSFKPGDLIEIEPLTINELRLRKKINAKQAEETVERLISKYKKTINR